MLDEFVKQRTRAMRDFSRDDILHALGLERRSTPIETAISTGIAFIAGAAAGAGLALLLAPKSGREMRADISSKASEMTNRLTSTASEIATDVRNALPIGDGGDRRTADAATRALGGTNRTS
jgi:hypothetical protein